jgi:hypothetical protein
MGSLSDHVRDMFNRTVDEAVAIKAAASTLRNAGAIPTGNEFTNAIGPDASSPTDKTPSY